MKNPKLKQQDLEGAGKNAYNSRRSFIRKTTAATVTLASTNLLTLAVDNYVNDKPLENFGINFGLGIPLGVDFSNLNVGFELAVLEGSLPSKTGRRFSGVSWCSREGHVMSPSAREDRAGAPPIVSPGFALPGFRAADELASSGFGARRRDHALRPVGHRSGVSRTTGPRWPGSPDRLLVLVAARKSRLWPEARWHGLVRGSAVRGASLPGRERAVGLLSEPRVRSRRGGRGPM